MTRDALRSHGSWSCARASLPYHDETCRAAAGNLSAYSIHGEPVDRIEAGLADGAVKRIYVQAPANGNSKVLIGLTRSYGKPIRRSHNGAHHLFRCGEQSTVLMVV